MTFRRVRRILIALIVLLFLAFGGFAALKKAHSMYKNLYTELDSVQSLLSDLGMRMTKLEQTVGTHVTHYDFDYSWIDQVPPFIAHACGMLEGNTYTNCLEAFQFSYDLGYRVFEMDFDLTQDHALVAVHSQSRWHTLTGTDESVPFTLENFNSIPLLEQYQSLNIQEIVDLMRQYPDIYLVTDTKYTDRVNVSLQFSQLVRCALETDPSILDRIIPQIYTEEMLNWVMSIHPFRSVVFTLYNTQWTPETVLRFCKATGVGFVTIFYSELTQEIADLFAPLGLHIGVHTVNNIPVANECLALGADMVYSDKLLPTDFIR